MTVVASVGGFVPKPHTPFQWFGQDTVGRARAQGRAAARPGPSHQGLTIRWHDPAASVGRGTGEPGRPPHGRRDRAGLAGRRHLPGVVGALRPVAVGVGPGGRGAEHRRGVPPGAGGRRAAAVGPHLRRAAPRLPLGRLAGRAGPGGRRGLPLDPLLRLRRLHRASAWSTSWRRRSPRPGGSQGTGQDLSGGDRIPVRLVEPCSPDEERRLRLRFTKAGKVRFTSHRDVARMWERALRRSRLPVAYSQGFSPHPLVSFGLALPTGCESHGEYLDVRLGPAAPEEIPMARAAGDADQPAPGGDRRHRLSRWSAKRRDRSSKR